VTGDGTVFGPRLSACRRSAGLTQQELADRSGLSIRAISNLELGRARLPHSGTVRRLADALELQGDSREGFLAAAQRRLGGGTAGRAPAGRPARAGGEPAPPGGPPPGADGSPAPAVVPRQLPAAAPHFTGRATELAALNAALQTAVISAIGGTPGVGKTALAVHFGHQSAGLFPDGQLYVNLGGFGPSGSPLAPGQAVRAFLDALGVRPEQVPAGLDEQVGLYRSLLAGRRVLVVLDNAADEQQVRPLLPGSPGCLAVVTSRRQLAGLAAAEGAALISLDCLPQAEALQLLAARLGSGRVAAEPGSAGELVAFCGGLPLALSIAAARGAVRPGFSLAELAGGLRQAGNSLDALDAGDPGASMRSVFSWSYQALSEPAARMFRLLGLHPGPEVSVAAAASLAGLGRPAARTLLDELTCASLLTEHRPGRYALHDLLRAYAREQAGALDSEADRRAATRRMLDHYLYTARAADRLLRPGRDPIAIAAPEPGTLPEEIAGSSQAVGWFHAEQHVLLAAAQLAHAVCSTAHAWKIPWTLTVFLDCRGDWQLMAAVQRTALAAASDGDDKLGQALACRDLARACLRLGRIDDCYAHLEHALRLYQETGDLIGQGRTHLALALALDTAGRYDEAFCHNEQALRLLSQAGDEAGRGNALSSVGWSHARRGDYANALACCHEAIKLQQESDNRYGEAHSLDSLGYVHRRLGQHAQAISSYQQSVRLFGELGDRYYQADALTNLGDTFSEAADPQRACGAWQRALKILDDLHHPHRAGVRARLISAAAVSAG
jgi:tetratricopeptide (TPR) repeat protein/DNA-binding XRE family transcriptional regulator